MVSKLKILLLFSIICTTILCAQNTNKRTGHIHVGFLNSNKDGKLPTNRETMLQTIEDVLKHVIKNF